MKRSPVLELRLSDQARDGLRASARGSRRQEQGGILVGFQTTSGLYIHDALVIADESATHGHYLRRAKGAGRALREYLLDQRDPLIGYVGEWHTHPLPAPPSATDHASMRLIASRNSQPTGLIVAALEEDKRSVKLHSLVSGPGSATGRLLGKYGAGIVVCES
jgi:hypothetical protein